MLRLLRHGDGGLCLFNGTSQTPDGYVDRVIALADAKGRPLGLAPHVGYGRLIAKRTLIVMDMGPPSLAAHGSKAEPDIVDLQTAHAGCLSFELSIGRHRIVTNCGSGKYLGSDWERNARGTAAHSTLVLASAQKCANHRFRVTGPQ